MITRAAGLDYSALGTTETVDVGDNFFSKPNLYTPNSSLNVTWNFPASRLHNVTLANGPIGIGSPNLNRDSATVSRKYQFNLNKPGRYELFLHAPSGDDASSDQRGGPGTNRTDWHNRGHWHNRTHRTDRGHGHNRTHGADWPDWNYW